MHEREAAARLAALEWAARQQATRQCRRAISGVVATVLAALTLVLLGMGGQALGLVP